MDRCQPPSPATGLVYVPSHSISNSNPQRDQGFGEGFEENMRRTPGRDVEPLEITNGHLPRKSLALQQQSKNRLPDEQADHVRRQ